jgi:peptidyl-prolyl isomerase G (cyclophilin G)
MVQGGDITNGNGTGGISIYGEEFEDENLEWRKIDKEGLVCMANRGTRDTNTSQFFITLEACPHINGKNTVFGHLVGEKSFETLKRIAGVSVDEDNDYRPLEDVIIARCGELVRKGQPWKSVAPPRRTDTAESNDTTESAETSTSRGRHKRRHSSSPSRSPSPSRGHGRISASRHRHRHRRKREESTEAQSASNSSTPRPAHRRRSDASPDHTLRGRPRQRSRSRTHTPIREQDDEGMDIDRKGPAQRLKAEEGYGWEGEHRHNRKRSPPPSRPRSRSPGFRRQRSLPNVYDQYAKAHGDRENDRDRRDGDKMDIDRDKRTREDSDRNSRDRKYGRFDRAKGRHGDDSHGRLGGGDGYGRLGGGDDWNDGSTGGVKYKGRGIMKYQESRRW